MKFTLVFREQTSSSSRTSDGASGHPNDSISGLTSGLSASQSNQNSPFTFTLMNRPLTVRWLLYKSTEL